MSRDAAAMAKHARSFDLLLNTIPVSQDVNPYFALLKIDGTMVLERLLKNDVKYRFVIDMGSLKRG